MTIKEAEKLVGITSANIRFYEKENLVTPGRNEGNNYRDYSEHDVEVLKKIKILRTLGVPVPDIRALIKEETELSSVIERQREKIKEEEKHLKDLEKVCRFIAEERMEFETMDSDVLERKVNTMTDRIEYVIQGDITKKTVTDKKMNAIVGAMVIYALLCSTAMIFMMGEFLIKNIYEILFPVILLDIVCAFGGVWTAKPWVQAVIFQFAVFAFSPIITIFAMLAFKIQGFIGESLVLYDEAGMEMESILMMRNSIAFYLLLLAGGVLILWILAMLKRNWFNNYWKIGLIMLGYTATASAIFTFEFHVHYIISFVSVFVMLFYISKSWTAINRGEGEINMYYTITSATAMINISVGMLNYQSIGMEKGYGRQEKWKE